MGQIPAVSHISLPSEWPPPWIDQGLIRHTWGGSWEDGRGLLGVGRDIRTGWTIGGLNVQDGLVINTGPFLQNGLCSVEDQ